MTFRTMTISGGRTIDVHPAADLFPMMSDAELDELAKDIEENGLVGGALMWLKGHPDGQEALIDGRNRIAAIERIPDEQERERLLSWVLGFKNLLPDDTDPLAFVVSLNLKRRHLDESQRSMVAAKIAILKDGQR